MANIEEPNENDFLQVIQQQQEQRARQLAALQRDLAAQSYQQIIAINAMAVVHEAIVQEEARRVARANEEEEEEIDEDNNARDGLEDGFGQNEQDENQEIQEPAESQDVPREQGVLADEVEECNEENNSPQEEQEQNPNVQVMSEKETQISSTKQDRETGEEEMEIIEARPNEKEILLVHSNDKEENTKCDQEASKKLEDRKQQNTHDEQGNRRDVGPHEAEVLIEHDPPIDEEGRDLDECHEPQKEQSCKSSNMHKEIDGTKDPISAIGEEKKTKEPEGNSSQKKQKEGVDSSAASHNPHLFDYTTRQLAFEVKLQELKVELVKSKLENSKTKGEY